MVDKDKRLQAADLINKLMSCEITNYEYDDRFPRSKDDPALHAIYTMLWFTYNDVREHRMDGKHSLSPQAREVFEQSALFLETDIEYTGQKSFVDVTAPFKRLWNLISMKKEPSAVPDCWPFDSLEQLEAARR